MANFRAKAKTGPPSPLVRTQPAENGNLVAFSAEADGFSVYVHREVLEFIERESLRAAPDEAIGLLAGRICQDPVRGPYTLVMAADSARPGEVEASPSHVHISAGGNASVRRRLEDTHPDREVIGWYHSHPRYPAQFSHVDIAEQSTWNDPNHIGIVFSGTEKDEPFGVYRGPGAVRLSRGHAQGRAGVTGQPDFRTERAAPAQALTERARHDGPKPTVVTVPPGGLAPAPRRAPSGEPIGAPRLFFALLLLGLAAFVVWLHVRVSSIEANLRGAAVSISATPEPTAPAQTPTPPPHAPAADIGPAADSATERAAPPGEQTNSAGASTLPTFIVTPDVMPGANPLSKRTLKVNNEKAKKKKRKAR
jgi:proteasome lid subunit RPN8/RPN11